MSESNSPPPQPTTATPEKQALIIAKSFIKTYYHTLSTSPTEIYKFYKNDVSQLSFSSECNTPSSTIMAGSESEPHLDFLKKFQNVIINFENGSIDAQISNGGGIFLVVTGYMKLQDSEKEERFVHTFFLSHDTKQGAKKHFFVLNDVFRFLTEVKEEKVEEQVENVKEEEKVEEETPVEIEEEEEEEVVIVEKEVVVEEVVEEEVEESEEEVVEEEEETPDLNQIKEEEVEEEPTPIEEEEEIELIKEDPNDAALFPAPSKPKTPGSWASLVASSASKPSEPQEKPTKPKAKKETVPPEPTEKEDKEEVVRNRSKRNKSYEPSSLYIKNMPDDLKESDLRALFSSYGHKIVNVYIVNLYPQRGFAFVDFDTPAAVTDIMKEPRNFVINGRTLDVEKKTGERRSSAPPPTQSRNGSGRGGRGGPPRRSSPRGMRRSSNEGRTRSNSGRRRGRGGRGS